MLSQNRATQIAEGIERQISSTTATEHSIERLAEQVVRDIKEFDDSIATTLEQRRRIVSLIEPFFSLYKSISGENLLNSVPGLSQLKDDPTDLTARLLTREVLGIADELWDDSAPDENGNRQITLGMITQALKKFASEEKLTIPWSNPGAVISTILTRNGDWERVSPKQYRRVGGSYGLFR